MTGRRSGRSALVELDGVAVGYGATSVITGVDLRVEAGEVIAVLGANGSGKSTLVRGILGLANLHAGTIRLFGQPSVGFHERWRLGYVPQRAAIGGAVPATVREVVTSGRLARLGLGRRLRTADFNAVDAALVTVDLDALAKHPVAHLSGGQQRRVSIARALAGEPELLVLDEPTAGIDAESQIRLADTLSNLHERGTTIILVAHELGPAAPLVSRVVVMGNGGIVFDGPPERAGGHRHGDHNVPSTLEEHHLVDEFGCEHQHEHGEAPLRPGTGLMDW